MALAINAPAPDPMDLFGVSLNNFVARNKKAHHAYTGNQQHRILVGCVLQSLQFTQFL